MLKSLKRFFAPDAAAEAAQEAYLAVVAAARQPVFYTERGVPDTLDGRFDLIVLHLFLVIHRLRAEAEAANFVRALAEMFFADMDRSLREMGVGDTGVGKRVKNMAQAFYGRLASYEHALSGGLEDSIRRNLYRDSGEEKPVEAMAKYARRNIAHLKTQPTEALLSGRLGFVD